MGSQLVPSGRGGDHLDRRGDAALARQLGALDRATEFGLARVEAQAQIEAHRVKAVGHVAQHGMQAVAMVSQLEAQLCQAVPHAAGRIQAIANTATLGVVNVITDATYRISK